MFLWFKNLFEHSDRRASIQLLHFGSSNHILFELYVNLQEIVHEKFISDVKLNIGAILPVR